MARRGFTPAGLIVPVSASMLQNRTDDDTSLEALSRPVMALVEYAPSNLTSASEAQSVRDLQRHHHRTITLGRR
jgi:hypothetical protein